MRILFRIYWRKIRINASWWLFHEVMVEYTYKSNIWLICVEKNVSTYYKWPISLWIDQKNSIITLFEPVWIKLRRTKFMHPFFYIFAFCDQPFNAIRRACPDEIILSNVYCNPLLDYLRRLWPIQVKLDPDSAISEPILAQIFSSSKNHKIRNLAA